MWIFSRGGDEDDSSDPLFEAMRQMAERMEALQAMSPEERRVEAEKMWLASYFAQNYPEAMYGCGKEDCQVCHGGTRHMIPANN